MALSQVRLQLSGPLILTPCPYGRITGAPGAIGSYDTNTMPLWLYHRCGWSYRVAPPAAPMILTPCPYDPITGASGAIGSPHLLLLSGIGDTDELKKAGTTCVLHLPDVGRHLQDHLTVPVRFNPPYQGYDAIDAIDATDAIDAIDATDATDAYRRYRRYRSRCFDANTVDPHFLFHRVVSAT